MACQCFVITKSRKWSLFFDKNQSNANFLDKLPTNSTSNYVVIDGIFEVRYEE